MPSSSRHKQPRKSQRPTLTCTECARRKQRCSKTIPCSSCLDRGIASSCRRNGVSALSPQPSSREESDPTRLRLDDYPHHPNSTLFSEPGVRTASPGSTQGGGDETQPDGSCTDEVVQDNSMCSRSHDQSEPKSYTSRPRLTNGTVSTLEFLTHGRRSILNLPHTQTRRASLSITVSSAAASSDERADDAVCRWDAVFSVADARRLLIFHQRHLAWMHNVLHMPTLIREFDMSLGLSQPKPAWMALYYAVLSVCLLA